jgi:hypothetical protein
MEIANLNDECTIIEMVDAVRKTRYSHMIYTGIGPYRL